MTSGFRFSSVPVRSVRPRAGVVLSLAEYGSVPVLEFCTRSAVVAAVPALFVTTLLRERFQRLLAGAHSVSVSAVFDSVRVCGACHIRDAPAFLDGWSRQTTQPLTAAELNAAIPEFMAETSAVAADEQSRLSATLYQRAGWGPGARVGLKRDISALAGLSPADLLGDRHAHTAVVPAGSGLAVDLVAHVVHEPPARSWPGQLWQTLHDDPIASASVSLGWTGPAWHEADFPAFYLAGRMLGGDHDSILMRVLRGQRGWAYSPWAAVHLRPAATLLELQARVGRERVTDGRVVILESLAELRDVPPDDLRRVTAAAAGQLRIGVSSQAGLAGTINHFDFVGPGLAGMDDLLTAVGQLAPADIAQAGDLYLRPLDVIEGT